LLPQFADTNFILVSTSPCIDAGNPNVQFDDPEDPENPGQALWPSQGQLRNDMGAYGGPHSCLLQDVTIGIKNNQSPFQELSVEVFPNPFSEFSRISVKGTFPGSEQKIELMDIKGQVVKRFLKIHQNMELIWDGCDDNGHPLNPGLYVLRLLSGNQTQTKKVFLIR
jgi:hypothetical protein